MCTCASCEYTATFKSFADWPRGNPAGKRSSDASYTAHVRHSQTWGRRQNGNMYHPPEFPGGVQTSPLVYRTPKPRDPGAHRSYPTAADAEKGTAHYVSSFIAANQYMTEAKAAERAEYAAMVAREEKSARKRSANTYARQASPLVQLARDLRAQHAAERRAA